MVRRETLVGAPKGILLCLAGTMLASCGGGGGQTSIPPPPTYSLSATVSGLSGSGLTLTLNGGAPTSVAANGTITLASGLATGVSYAVAINLEPVIPVQTCTVSGGSGTVGNANVSIAIACIAGTTNTVNAAQVTVSIDSAISPVASSTIANLVSPIDMQPPGKSLYMPLSGSGGESAVVAVDSAGNIVLASLATTTSVNLTADSTALFLVRLVMGTMPDTGTAVQVNAAIRSTAEYPNLVSLITANLAANTPASTSTNVYASVDTVFSQLPSAILQALSLHGTVGAHNVRPVVHAQGIPVATPNLTGPTNLFTTRAAGYAIGAVAITGTTADGSLTATNTTAIAWSIASADTSGAPICPLGASATSGNPDCSVTLERTSLAKQVVSNAVSAGTIPGNGDAFNITLEQNLVSRTQNVVQTVEDTASEVLALATAGESLPYQDCLDSAIEKFLKPADIANLVADPTGDGFNAYFKSVFTTSTVFAIAKGCASLVAPFLPTSSSTTGPIAFAQSLTAFYTGFSNYVKDSFLDVATVGVNAFGIPLEIAQTYKAWNQSFTVGVCEGGSPPSIVSCAVSLTFNPTSGTVTAGDIFAPTITALDASGNPTLLPPDLLFASSDTSVATVDKTAGIAMAQTLPSGETTASATVTGIDGNTGLTGNYTVTVVTEGPGTCIPLSGAATCTVTLYDIDSGETTEAAIAAPVLATTTTVTVYNGTTTSQTMAQPLGAALYETVPGVCDPRVPGCPDLISHNAELCSVDGKWTPATFSYIISTEYTSSGCTGVGLHSDITGGFTLSASGQLIATGELKQHGSTTCNNGAGLITVFSGTYDNLQTVNLDLSTGAGSASLIRNDQEDSTDNNTPPGMLHQTVTGSGSVTWPAETTLPVQLANTGITVSQQSIAAGQVLPVACLAGASQTNSLRNRMVQQKPKPVGLH